MTDGTSSCPEFLDLDSHARTSVGLTLDSLSALSLLGVIVHGGEDVCESLGLLCWLAGRGPSGNTRTTEVELESEDATSTGLLVDLKYLQRLEQNFPLPSYPSHTTEVG